MANLREADLYGADLRLNPFYIMETILIRNGNS